MKKPKPCFLVLESYWSEDLRVRDSVHPFVEGLCDLNGWEYHYRTFDSANDLELWIRMFNTMRRSGKEKILYLATHGSRAGKLLTLEQNIPMATLARLLEPARSLVGVHLGSCNLGQPRLLRRLAEKTPVRWIAAYEGEVPWLESTALDMLFWSWIYSGAPRAKRSRRLSPEAAAHELYARFNYSQDMGFRVRYRERPEQPFSCSWDSWRARPRA